MALSHRFLPAIWVVSLIFIGGAWAQSYPGASKSANMETKSEDNFLEPWQPCLTPDLKEINGPVQAKGGPASPTIMAPSINKPFSGDNHKKAGVTRGTSTKSNSLGTSFGKYGSVTQNKGFQTGGPGGLLGVQGSKQSGGPGSSFLDGYLLKSLKDQKTGRKATEDKQSEDDPRKQIRKAF